MAMADEVSGNLDLREQILRIDKIIAHIERNQEIRFAPWQLALAGMTSGGALFAAGAAFFKLIS